MRMRGCRAPRRAARARWPRRCGRRRGGCAAPSGRPRARGRAAVGTAVERHVEPLDEPLLHAPGPSSARKRGGLGEAVIGAGGEDVAGQQLRGVVLAAEDDAALGAPRVGGRRVVARDTPAGPRRRARRGERGGQAGDAGTQHQHVAALAIGERHAPPSARGRAPAAEWVRAPTEMKSTPVSAIARAVSRVTPPEASRRARPPTKATALRMARGPCCPA